jgi:hypothetical protein
VITGKKEIVISSTGFPPNDLNGFLSVDGCFCKSGEAILKEVTTVS